MMFTNGKSLRAVTRLTIAALCGLLITVFSAQAGPKGNAFGRDADGPVASRAKGHVEAPGRAKKVAGTVAASAIPTGFSSVAVFATHSAWLQLGSDVLSGDVVVNEAGVGPFLTTGQELTIGFAATTPAGFSVKADTLRVRRTAVVNGTVFCNELTDGTRSITCNPLSLPVFDTLPPFVAEPPRAGAPDIFVPIGGSTVLPPGDYGNLRVRFGGTVIFTGGIYNIRHIDAGLATNLLFDAASEIRVADKFSIDADSFLGPNTGAAVGASDIIFYVAGINGTSGTLGAVPKAAKIGIDAEAHANFYVPNGTLWLRAGSNVFGAFLGRDVNVGVGAQVTLDSFFVNQPPVADPQTVFTAGLEPIEITLTGSDPDNDDLTFSIETDPTQGMLGPVLEDPQPGAGTCTGRDGEGNPTPPGCTLPDPPRTSATVVYTPSTGDDLPDSFVFKVTDPSGGMGTATVDINPDDATPPPEPVTTVVADDTSVETSEDTPVTILMTAQAPCEGECDGIGFDSPLTFGVLGDGCPTCTGPTNGLLSNLTQNDLVEPQRSATVLYTPDLGFVGTDSFTFEACDDTLPVPVCDTGTATVDVVPTPRLAVDQTVTTVENVPVLIDLGAGSGGLPPGEFSIPASIAGGVTDTNEDGLGDATDPLPGREPTLRSAAITGEVGSETRLQIEFDVSSLGDGSEISDLGATVTLHTQVGPDDSLPTDLFSALCDRQDPANCNGLLDNADYENSVIVDPQFPLPDAIMPVPGDPAGTEGTFTFNVFNSLALGLQARIGADFFVIQGRVGELGQGLQVFTTAEGNIAADKVPMLNIESATLAPPITYRLTALPAFGTLTDINGNPVSAGVALPSKLVTYTPDVGFTGDDSFAIEGTVGLIIDSALVTLIVDPNQCVETGREPGCAPGQ